MTKQIFDHVSFCGDFNKEHTPIEPAGSDILDYIVSQLDSLNIEVKTRGHTDYSHYILVNFDNTIYRLEIGYVSDEHSEWLLFFTLNNFWLRIFRAFFADQYRKLALIINRILKASSEVSEVRWYKNKNNWNNNPDQYFSMENY